MGIDCWHVLKSPLNFTELFSPFLAPYRVICLPWFHSDLSNSPVLKKKVKALPWALQAFLQSWVGTKMSWSDQLEFHFIFSQHTTGKSTGVRQCALSTSSCCFFNYFTEVWLTYLLYWGMIDISFIMSSKNMACHFTLLSLIPSPLVLQMSYNGHFNSNG